MKGGNQRGKAGVRRESFPSWIMREIFIRLRWVEGYGVMNEEGEKGLRVSSHLSQITRPPISSQSSTANVFSVSLKHLLAATAQIDRPRKVGETTTMARAMPSGGNGSGI